MVPPLARTAWSAWTLAVCLLLQSGTNALVAPQASAASPQVRERISINSGWRFSRVTTNPDSLSYTTLKAWMLPAAKDFVAGTKRQRPSGTSHLYTSDAAADMKCVDLGGRR